MWKESEGPVEVILNRKGGPEYKKVDLPMLSKKASLECYWLTEEDPCIVLGYKFGDEALLVVWDLYSDAEVANFTPSEPLD